MKAGPSIIHAVGKAFKYWTSVHCCSHTSMRHLVCSSYACCAAFQQCTHVHGDAALVPYILHTRAMVEHACVSCLPDGRVRACRKALLLAGNCRCDSSYWSAWRHALCPTIWLDTWVLCVLLVLVCRATDSLHDLLWKVDLTAEAVMSVQQVGCAGVLGCNCIGQFSASGVV